MIEKSLSSINWHTTYTYNRVYIKTGFVNTNLGATLTVHL